MQSLAFAAASRSAILCTALKRSRKRQGRPHSKSAHALNSLLSGLKPERLTLIRPSATFFLREKEPHRTQACPTPLSQRENAGNPKTLSLTFAAVGRWMAAATWLTFRFSPFHSSH